METVNVEIGLRCHLPYSNFVGILTAIFLINGFYYIAMFANVDCPV